MREGVGGKPLPYVLVDMDGTLANIDHRVGILGDSLPHRWERFNSRCVDDAPTAVVRWCQALGMYFDIIVVSARPATVRKETLDWLAAHGVPYTELLMRSENDQRGDIEIKRDMLLWLRSDGREIAFVIDDRPEVVEMWRAEGLRVFPVHQDRWEVVEV